MKKIANNITKEQCYEILTHETPYYLVDIGKFKENINKLRRPFKKRYQNMKVAYSYKTNYNQSITVKKYVGGIDIVGNKCIETDILRPNATNELKVNDIIKFKNVGAYSMSRENDFITEKIRKFIYDNSNLEEIEI